MKKNLGILLTLILSAFNLFAQNEIKIPDNIVAEGIPALSNSYINDVKKYTEFKSASLVEVHPNKREILISTRAQNSNQLFYLSTPLGEKSQITFFNEPVGNASYEPVNGSYFIFSKDSGGNEFSQLYRYDIGNKNITLLTDGKRSQNGNITWTYKGDQIAYASTKRNGKDRDFYLMNPQDPSSEKLIVKNEGGGWSISAWSSDDSKLIVREGISVNESRIYSVDVNTGEKVRLLPLKDERATYSAITYANSEKGMYLITNKDSEYNRLAYYDFKTEKLVYITEEIEWDVEDAEMNESGNKMLFMTNENGMSKIYLLNTANNRYGRLENMPTGLIGGLKWFNGDKSFAYTYSNYKTTSDVYEYVLDENKIERWTESELGGFDPSNLQEPELITWKSFDGKIISGYLYKAASKFEGKRPVIISIHGGPEGQSRPNFIARNNYFLNELGISIIYPNVRGSTGYGKTFLDADNGFKREESVKDIGALLDFIKTQNNLDADRVMVMGGSYGGYMSLAVAYNYSDKIRCAIDIVGISNFNTFMKNTESYRRDLRRVEYGDERDPKMAAFFEEIAPLNHTDKIKKPMFIIQGGNDPRVPLSEAEQMKEKIKSNGGVIWYLMAKDEGHGFRKKNNVDYQFYSTIEYIKRYLIN